MADEPVKHPGGRPTDFYPELGEEILALMERGLSLAAAAASVGIHRQRVYDWLDKHPEFADTIRLAQAKRQLFLEERLLSAEAGPVVTSTIFALKNAGPEDWREKVVNEHTGKDGGPIQTQSKPDFADLSPDERDAVRAILSARAGKSSGGAD